MTTFLDNESVLAEFDRRFATTGCESPIGFTACPEPTTASQVVKEFILTALLAKDKQIAEERKHFIDLGFEELAKAEKRGFDRACALYQLPPKL